MFKMFFVLFTLISFQGFAKNAKVSQTPGGRSPATQGDFSDCTGIAGSQDLQMTVFTQSTNFSDLKSGEDVEIVGNITTAGANANKAKLKINKTFTVSRMNITPKKGSGWNDVILSSSFVSGAMTIENQAPQEVLLVCENHNRERY